MKSAFDEATGHHVLNYTVCPEAAAIVVTGVPFSGIPIVATMLQGLGLSFGESGEIPFAENPAEVTSSISIGDRWLQLCRTGPRKWAIAAPRLINHSDAFLCYAQSVRFVFVVRDVLASSFDACQSGAGAQPRLAVEHAVELAFSLQRLKLLPAPILLLSYERCLQDPESTLSLLALFCGLTPSENIRASDISIMKGHEVRHNVIDKVSFRGRIDRVVGGRLVGWARAEGGAGQPFEVTFYLDDQRIDTHAANVFREDLATAGVGDGCYGFEFALPMAVRQDAIVDVRIGDTSHSLENSGRPLSDY